MKLLSAGNKLIIELYKEEDKTTDSGIILTGDSTESPSIKGVVISVGPETSFVQPLDVVFFKRGKSFPMKVDDKAYFSLDESDVLAMLRD